MGFDETRSTPWERRAIGRRLGFWKSSALIKVTWYEAPRDGRSDRSRQVFTRSPTGPDGRLLRRRAEAGSPPGRWAGPWARCAGIRCPCAAGDDQLGDLPGGEAGDGGNSPADAALLPIYFERDSVRRAAVGDAGRPRASFPSDEERMASGPVRRPLEPASLPLRPVQVDARPRRASLRAHAVGRVPLLAAPRQRTALAAG